MHSYPEVVPWKRSVLPLGDAQEAQVDIKFGAGELVTRKAAPGALVEGTFKGGVKHRLDGAGRVELRQDLDGGIPWLDHEARWDVGLTAEVPLDLRLEVGAYRGTVDLGDLRLRTLELHTGASDTLVRLPRAAGSTTVRAEAGAASLTIEVPSGVAARIRSRMALGSSQVDETRFPRIGDIYQSADYGTSIEPRRHRRPGRGRLGQGGGRRAPGGRPRDRHIGLGRHAWIASRLIRCGWIRQMTRVSCCCRSRG